MEGSEVHDEKSPYLHPELGCGFDIFTKEGGYGYCGGALASAAYHLWNRPGAPPFRTRVHSVINRAPLAGMRIGGWMGLRALLEFKLAGYRGEADCINSFISTAVVGGLAAAVHGGPVAATAIVLATGVTLIDSAIERGGASTNFNREKSSDK